MTFTAVFDWDGVIVDSQELICEGYRSAGVDPPADILAQEGGNWLVEQCEGDTTYMDAVRETKNAYYLKHIGDCAELPPMGVAWHMHMADCDGPQRTIVMSAAPPDTALWLPHKFTAYFDAMVFNIRTPAKMRTFKRLHAATGLVATYIDDNDKFIDMPKGWSFIHYTGGEITYEDVRRCSQ